MVYSRNRVYEMQSPAIDITGSDAMGYRDYRQSLPLVILMFERHFGTSKFQSVAPKRRSFHAVNKRSI